jgi:serine/threonine protein kinase
MEWATRMAIAKGIVRALTYLHDEMDIIHGNLTSRNVLLDEQSHPKISDYGLFRLMTTATNSNVLAAARELGYCAPELSNLLNASTKTDVYSLGIIILELLTGKSPSGIDLPRLRKLWRSDTVFDLELMWDREPGPSDDELVGTLKLALQCVEPSPSVRPLAREVLEALEQILLGRPEDKHLRLNGDVDDQSFSHRRQQPTDFFEVSVVYQCSLKRPIATGFVHLIVFRCLHANPN